VFDNLGQFASRVNLEVTAEDLSRIASGSAPGSHRLFLLWDGVADDGNPAATGAYVFVWKAVSGGDAPQASGGKRIFGLLRNR
jgi:hypothetical protein